MTTLTKKLSECCEAEVTVLGFCTKCGEHAEVGDDWKVIYDGHE